MDARKIVILGAITLVILTGMVIWLGYPRSKRDVKLKSTVVTEAAPDMKPHPHTPTGSPVSARNPVTYTHTSRMLLQEL